MDINGVMKRYKIKIKNPVMGVPITFLDKYCPTQFRIVGMSASAKYRKEIVGLPFIGNENKDDGRPILNGKNTYARIFIQKI